MASFQDLPVETVAEIVRYSNLNGDLPSLRLCSPQLNSLICHQSNVYRNDLCFNHGVTLRVLDMFCSQKPWHSHPRARTSEILDVIAVGRFLQDMTVITADLDRLMTSPINVQTPGFRPVGREPFVLFGILSQAVNTSLTIPMATGDVLAPSPNNEHSVSGLLSKNFVRLVKETLGLEELESAIAAINMSTIKLWSSLLLFRPKDSTVGSFGSLTGVSSNADQAILAEHVIWKGPSWVARILERYTSPTSGQTGLENLPDVTIVEQGIWKGSREEGARLAANGVARLLWKERQDKIEQRAHDSKGRIAIADLRVDPAVWRGSSGEM